MFAFRYKEMKMCKYNVGHTTKLQFIPLCRITFVFYAKCWGLSREMKKIIDVVFKHPMTSKIEHFTLIQ